ncbi:MAG TPA: hypothetical protein VEB22_04400, partial [Phycisphaerales bacterium]|nr:hypothetical protein [Phycisphaerales bacterium]
MFPFLTHRSSVPFLTALSVFVLPVCSGLAQPPEPPTPAEYSAVAKQHVATQPLTSSPDAEANVALEPRRVRANHGAYVNRDVYRWNTPANMQPMCWENCIVPMRVEPGELFAQGYRTNLSMMGAWVPGNFFPR